MARDQDKRERENYPSKTFVIRSIEGSTAAHSRDAITGSGAKQDFAKRASKILSDKKKK